jgi:hypothetical protein
MSLTMIFQKEINFKIYIAHNLLINSSANLLIIRGFHLQHFPQHLFGLSAASPAQSLRAKPSPCFTLPSRSHSAIELLLSNSTFYQHYFFNKSQHPQSQLLISVNSKHLFLLKQKQN